MFLSFFKYHLCVFFMSMHSISDELELHKSRDCLELDHCNCKHILTMASCTRLCCFWSFFTISMLVICGYICFCGWWLPIETQRHRLRYNQLNAFEIYTVNTVDWFKYNMDTQRIQIISYSQHRPFKYKYLIGLHDPDDTNSSSNMAWPSFSKLVEAKHENDPSSYLYIVQYSHSKCLDLRSCFEGYADDHGLNQNLDFDAFAFSNISGEYAFDLDSMTTSSVLDGTRDFFQCLIMLLLSLWLLLLMEYFDDDDTETAERLVTSR